MAGGIGNSIAATREWGLKQLSSKEFGVVAVAFAQFGSASLLLKSGHLQLFLLLRLFCFFNQAAIDLLFAF